MHNVFEFSPSKLTPPVIIATVVVVVGLIWQGWRWPHLLRIGLRNVPRRKLRTALVLVRVDVSDYLRGGGHRN